MALRLCLGTSSRFSILKIPHFASPLLSQAIVAPIAVRCYGTKKMAETRAAHADDKFTGIYKFPYIVQAAALCRVKIYQTGLTAIMMPLTVALNSAGMATIEQCQVASAVCVFACVVLYIMSSFFRRLVGIMYLNDAKDTLKISHLTFMGAREDTYIPVQDVVPLADLGMGPRTLYYRLKLYSSEKEYYYYILRFGGIVQRDMFAEVFGEEALVRSPQKS